MQGTIFTSEFKHECAKGKPRWIRLPNPTTESRSRAPRVERISPKKKRRGTTAPGGQVGRSDPRTFSTGNTTPTRFQGECRRRDPQWHSPTNAVPWWL